MNFNEYPDREMMMIDLANQIAGELGEALRAGDRASLCVPGGTTPGPVFDVLSDVALDWGRVDVLLNDERWVPEDHDRSNTRLLRQRLLVNRAAAANYVPLYAPTETPEESMDLLAKGIQPVLPLSVLILGMGADMHTASLFPNAPGLRKALEPNAPILVPVFPEDQPEGRVTLSARVLDGAISKHLLITGDAKRVALQNAVHLEPEDAPINAVLGGATVHWAP